MGNKVHNCAYVYFRIQEHLRWGIRDFLKTDNNFLLPLMIIIYKICQFYPGLLCFGLILGF